MVEYKTIIISVLTGVIIILLRDIIIKIVKQIVKKICQILNINNQKSFKDKRDKKRYRIIKIGKYTWMAQNLNFDNPGSWKADHHPKYHEEYGRLYPWDLAIKICPKGWHLPNDQEWQDLLQTLGGNNIAGNKLKSEGIKDWVNNNDADNSSKFSALPGGIAMPDGKIKDFCMQAFFWSSSLNDNLVEASSFSINFHDPLVYKGYLPLTIGLSIRCIKDY